MKTAAVFTLLMTLAGSGLAAEPQSVPAAWSTYRSETLAYELRHPDDYTVFATGPEGERDESRIRVARQEYAAPTPVLDIYVRQGAAGVTLPLETRRHWAADDGTVELAGARCPTTTYRFRPGGEIALVEVRCPDVLFRLTPAAGDDPDVRRTVWWRIMSTFRFLPTRR